MEQMEGETRTREEDAEKEKRQSKTLISTTKGFTLRLALEPEPTWSQEHFLLPLSLKEP